MQRASVDTCRLVGGALSLDFANTVDWDADGAERPAHTEALAEPEDVAAWGARLGVVDRELHVTARELAAARELRHATHDAFAALAAGRRPAGAALDTLKRHYGEAVAAATLRRGDDGWAFAWRRDDPRRVRFAVAVDAVDLLRDEARLARLRACPGSNCGWLFLDTSGRRRWCSMEVCGSRAKMRRLYARRRASQGPRP
jgi:predicted RNA-binding Zn ribbon-like protein